MKKIIQNWKKIEIKKLKTKKNKLNSEENVKQN